MATNRIRIFFDIVCTPAPIGFIALYRPVGSGITYRRSASFSASPIDFNDTSDALNTNYEGYVVSDCGNGNYSQIAAFTTSQTNVSTSSSAANLVINDIGGIPGFTLSGTLSSGHTQTGSHTAFTGQVNFRFSNSPAIPCNATLYVNGTAVDCINMITPGVTYYFASRTFLNTDVINLSFGTGSC